jgi:hypothetical protein
MISVEFVGSPGLQNKSQQRASAKNCHQTTYGQPDVLFREIEKSCEIDPAHFLVRGCWWYV